MPDKEWTSWPARRDNITEPCPCCGARPFAQTSRYVITEMGRKYLEGKINNG